MLELSHQFINVRRPIGLQRAQDPLLMRREPFVRE